MKKTEIWKKIYIKFVNNLYRNSETLPSADWWESSLILKMSFAFHLKSWRNKKGLHDIRIDREHSYQLSNFTNQAQYYDHWKNGCNTSLKL